MPWTKRELITQAFTELGLPSYNFDLAPEQLESARRSLDAMIATWDKKGIFIGYPLPGTADGSDLDEDSGIIDGAIETVYQSLAIRLASSLGKAASPDTKASARSGFLALCAGSTPPPQRQIDNNRTPAGAGWRSPRGSRFLPPPRDTIYPTELET